MYHYFHLKMPRLRKLVAFFIATFMLSAEAQQSEQKKFFTISGFVSEQRSGEPLIGVNVYSQQTKQGTTTNAYGFYSITLPSDSVVIQFSYVGYQTIVDRFYLNGNLKLNIMMEEKAELSEVVIQDRGTPTEVQNPQMSKITISVADVKNVPTLFGEKDVFKVIQLLPGVQKGSEGQSGFYVRGGGPDQNLIILDDAVVYNAFHLFGFFSLFNGDAIKSIELSKGGFPARYGGRLSSVLDINMKEGNRKEYKGEFGIGLISSRATLEGPILKDKASFLISARRTYADLLIRPFLPRGQSVGYYFYDFTAKINADITDKDKLYLSVYSGRDRFFARIKEDDYAFNSGLGWGNITSTLRWNHLYNNKLFSNTSFIFSRYNLGINASYSADRTDLYSMEFNSGIRDFSLKHDFEYSYNLQHQIRFGAIATNHFFTPRAVQEKGQFVENTGLRQETYNTVESGVYVEDNWRISNRLRANVGLRISHFVAESRHYVRPEPRLSASYLINSKNSFKASYANMNQYVHLLSNTGIGLPTDLWVPATKRVGPQNSHQVAIGWQNEMRRPKLHFSLEGYYKKMNGVITYVEGANFFGIEENIAGNAPKWEQNITTGQGWSYGIEALLQKKLGDFTGWIGYTLSWTQMQFDEVNNGKKFYARHDRRHDVSVVGMYKLSKSVTFSGTWVYGTGNAITLPVAQAYMPNHIPGVDMGFIDNRQVTLYTERNAFRMAAFHRLDLGVQFTKKLDKAEQTIEVSVYNAYNRQNPFFYYVNYSSSGNRRVLTQVSLFPLIPSITYSLKF